MNTDPELLRLIAKAKADFERMSPAEQAAMIHQQRKSWCIGEMMLEHPEMTLAEAEGHWARAAVSMGLQP